MAYKFTKGAQVIGDLKAADDTNRDTMIDFGEDRIDLQTHGSTRFKISGSNGEITFNEAYKFPTSDGNADQVLQTNGSGQLSFVDVSGGGGGGGSSTPQVLKVGLLGSNLTFAGGASLQTVPFDSVLFDTFQNGAGYRTGSFDFIAKEEGYYDIQVSLVVDEIEDILTQYQLYIASSGSTSTLGAGGVLPFVAIGQYNPNHTNSTPGTVNQRTFHVGTIEHFAVNQSASVVVRQIGGSGNESRVMLGRNKSFMCIKKL